MNGIGSTEPEPAAPAGRTLRLARPAAGWVLVATLFGAASIGAGVGLLATSGWLISRAAEHPSIAALGLGVVGVRFFALSRGLFRYGERVVGHEATFRTLADLRVHVYRRLERLAPSGIPGFRRGDLLSRLVSDVDSQADVILRVITPYGAAMIVGAATVGLVWWLLPSAAVVLALCLALAALGVPRLTQALARRSEARQAGLRGELTASFVDLVDGAPDLIACGAMDRQLGRIAEADAALTRAAAASARTTGTGSAMIALLTGLAVWGSLLVGVPAVGSGRLDGVQLAVIVLIPLVAFELVVALPAATQAFERARRSAGRVFAVCDEAPPVKEALAPAPLPAPPYSVRVRGLRSRHSADGRWVLDGVDLDLAPGRRIGLVGPSGAGKTTLAQVLVRFLPYEGSVMLNGVELHAFRGDDVRKVIGLVEQGAHVFDATLGENLRLARRDASDEDVRTALERARLLDWVESLPNGFDTTVGANGIRLSGGQRQRLALARALLADFPVVVLDEPGEHLDVATADALVHDLVDATRGRTTLLVTHRLAGLEAMDEVLVLENGRVVERGTHHELVAQRGRYGRLWRLEQGGNEP